MKAKLQFLLSTIGSQLADIWNRSKMFLLAIAALVVALEWQKLKEFMLVYMGQKQINNAKKEDSTLAAKESTENVQADALVQKASNEPTDADWYKKQ